MFNHQVQQPQRALAIQEEVLVHDEERPHTHRLLQLAHHLEQLVPGPIEVHDVAFAAEHCRCRTEVAAKRTANRRNQRGRHVAGFFAEPDAHRARGDARNDMRMAHRPVGILTQEAPHPSHTLALDDVVGIYPLLDLGNICDRAADDDGRRREVATDQFAHRPHLVHVGHDRADANDVVTVGPNLLNKAVEGWEIQERARDVDVGMNQHQTPRTMKHPQRKRFLRSRHLAVVKLHRLVRPAAVFVTLRIRAKDTG